MNQKNKLIIPKIIGHRGVKNLSPENTINSIKKAIELGASFRDYGKNEVSSYISIDTKAYINVYTNEENSIQKIFCSFFW